MLVSLNDTVQTHADKIQHMETKMVNLYTAHNNIVDAYADQETELQRMQAKTAKLEDLLRWDNIKCRVIPESVTLADLTNFIQGLMKASILSLSYLGLCIDRANRIPKPKFFTDTAPQGCTT